MPTLAKSIDDGDPKNPPCGRRWRPRWAAATPPTSSRASAPPRSTAPPGAGQAHVGIMALVRGRERNRSGPAADAARTGAVMRVPLLMGGTRTSSASTWPTRSSSRPSCPTTPRRGCGRTGCPPSAGRMRRSRPPRPDPVRVDPEGVPGRGGHGRRTPRLDAVRPPGGGRHRQLPVSRDLRRLPGAGAGHLPVGVRRPRRARAGCGHRRRAWTPGLRWAPSTPPSSTTSSRTCRTRRPSMPPTSPGLRGHGRPAGGLLGDFAATGAPAPAGQPSWPRYVKGGTKVMRFTPGNVAPHDAHAAHRCAFWSTLGRN